MTHGAYTMTHGAYLHLLKLKMEEIGIIEGPGIEVDDAKELVKIIPTIALEHVINNPQGIHHKHKWCNTWLELCQGEYAERMLLS